jgi:hypothetical protein
MEPNNLELEIKKKLIVKQSSLLLAWDRLEAMLDNAEKTGCSKSTLALSQLVLLVFYFGYNFKILKRIQHLKKCSVRIGTKGNTALTRNQRL